MLDFNPIPYYNHSLLPVAHGFCVGKAGNQLWNMSRLYSEDFERNRANALASLGLNSPLALPNQCHTNQVSWVKKGNLDEMPCDGFMTDESISLGILTADCIPVLLYHPKGIIGALHLGWKGVLGGLVNNACNLLSRKGLNVKDLQVAIGPCIRNYEMDQPVKDLFTQQRQDDALFFTPNAKGRYQLDLVGLLRQQWLRNEVYAIGDIGLCTYTNINLFFSHRHLTHYPEIGYNGRQLSLIGL